MPGWVRRTACVEFPGPGRITQISNHGGGGPVWAKDGSRLYYGTRSGLMEAKVVPGSDLEFEAPQRVLAASFIPRSESSGASFDIARDGRLIMSNVNMGSRTSERPSLVVVLNWFEVVERRAPKR